MKKERIPHPAFQRPTVSALFYGPRGEGATIDKSPLILIGISDPCQGELPKIAQADRPLAPFSRQAQRRNEDREQDRNYGNYNQQLDESEAVAMDDRVRMPLRPTRIRLPTSRLALSATHCACSHPPNNRPSGSTGIHFLKGAKIQAGPSISVSITTLYCATGAEFVNIIRRNIAFAGSCHDGQSRACPLPGEKSVGPAAVWRYTAARLCL